MRVLERPGRWRWLLTEEDSGQAVADHQVELAGGAGFIRGVHRFVRYLRWHVVPDRRGRK